MNQVYIEKAQQASFFGGTLTGVIANLSAADVLSTIILSALGAIVSFWVSYRLRRIFNDKNDRDTDFTRAEWDDEVSDDIEANGP